MDWTDPRPMRVVIVGSGPAGVSAAWPLVEAGIEVVMLDGGGADLPLSPSGTIGTLRLGGAHAQTLFGDRVPRPVPVQDQSPKLATPLARAVLDGFPERTGLTTRGFFAAGSLATGGLSHIWGAALARFGDDTLARFPVPAADMRASYDRVLRRIGTSLADLSPPLAHVIDAEGRNGGGVLLERAANAVLAEPREDRAACNRCGLCLFGCHRGSIYNAAHELPALRRHPNFTHRPGHVVETLEPEGEGHRILFATGQAPLFASRVILAAGTIGTTALVLRRLGALGQELPLLTNPLGAMAFIVPRFFGADLPDRSFALAQLHYRLALPEGGSADGLLYAADTLPSHAIADRLPLSRPAARRFVRALAPALIVASCYLPGSYSRNRIRLDHGDSPRLTIEGEQTGEARAALRWSARRLARHLRRRGAYMLPGSLTIAEPGTDAHYAGTLPMGAGGRFGCGPDGALNGVPGLHIADGACLPVLPAEHCTLTIMANANRIGRLLAGRSGTTWMENASVVK